MTTVDPESIRKRIILPTLTPDEIAARLKQQEVALGVKWSGHMLASVERNRYYTRALSYDERVRFLDNAHRIMPRALWNFPKKPRVAGGRIIGE